MMKHLIAALIAFAGLVSANTAYANHPPQQNERNYSARAYDHGHWHTHLRHRFIHLPLIDNRTWRASFYGGGPKRFEPNAHTANGERFNQWDLTAAHRTLPMGTRLQVCYRGCAVVRVNDRGPAAWTGRSLDLSRGAAAQIGMIDAGSAPVRVTVLN